MSPARVTTVVTLTLLAVVASATSASASTTPDTWAQGESMSTLGVIGVFVGLPVALFLVIYAVGAVIAAKSRNFVPAPPSTDVEVAAGSEAAAH